MSSSTLSAAAQTRLEQGIGIYISADYNSDSDTGPSWLKFDLNAPMWEEMTKASHACRENAWTRVTLSAAPSLCDAACDVSIRYWELRVDGFGSFTFVGQPKYGSGECSSHDIAFDDLAEALNAAVVLDELAEDDTLSGFAQYAGALFHAENDLVSHIENVCDAIPQLIADHVARNMTSVIAQASGAPSDDVKRAPGRRHSI